MALKFLATAGLALALAMSSAAQGQELTPEQRAEHRAKAETAARLVTFGQRAKDGAMLNAAANLIDEVGPVAREVKDGKPVNYDTAALRKEAEGYGAAPMSAASRSVRQCSWFYNCDSYNNCFWDQWC